MTVDFSYETRIPEYKTVTSLSAEGKQTKKEPANQEFYIEQKYLLRYKVK